MNKTAIYIAIIIIIGLLIGWAFFWRNSADAPIVEIEESEAEGEMRMIMAKHQYEDGSHIVAGEVDLPTPCHILTTDANVVSGNQVFIAFTSTTQAEMCAQVITPARFKVEFDAEENALIKATWNGAPANLNLIPVDADESLVDFEIFIKG